MIDPNDPNAPIGPITSAPIGTPAEGVQVAIPQAPPQAPAPVSFGAGGAMQQPTRAELEAEVEYQTGQPVAALRQAGVMTPEIEAMFAEADQQDATAAELRRMADEKRLVVRRNPLYQATKNYTDTMGGAGEDPGLMAQADQIQQQVADARVAEAQVEYETFADRAATYRDMAIDHRASEHTRLEQLQAMRQSQMESLSALDDATEQVKSAREIDPMKWWKDRSTAGKIFTAVATALTGFGGGWNGDIDAGQRFVQKMMDNEIAKQKEEYGRLQNVVDLRQRQLGERDNLYAQLMATMQDERQAELGLENIQLEALLAEADAMRAKAGVRTFTAEQEAELNQWRQKLAENRRTIEALAATNVKQTVSSAYVHDRDARERLRHQADRLEGRSDLLQQAEVGLRGDQAKGRLASVMAEAAAERVAASTKKDDTYQQRVTLEKESRPYRIELRAIDQFLTEYKDEIPGMMLGLGWKKKARTKEETIAYERAKRAVSIKLRRESGAVISDSEIDWAAGQLLDNATSEDQVRALLRDRRDEAQAAIDLIERAAGDVAVEEFTRSAPIERTPLRQTQQAPASARRIR